MQYLRSLTANPQLPPPVGSAYVLGIVPTYRSITMFQMFNQLFSAFTTFFVALEKIAKASNHLATWSEETAGAFADEARLQRQAKKQRLEQELNRA